MEWRYLQAANLIVLSTVRACCACLPNVTYAPEMCFVENGIKVEHDTFRPQKALPKDRIQCERYSCWQPLALQ
jgi:hypothetical protein